MEGEGNGRVYVRVVDAWALSKSDTFLGFILWKDFFQKKDSPVKSEEVRKDNFYGSAHPPGTPEHFARQHLPSMTGSVRYRPDPSGPPSVTPKHQLSP